jgi:L-fucose isomerase-like protein
VIADSTIGRVAEARLRRKFKKVWRGHHYHRHPPVCYGAETLDSVHMTIKGVWAFKGTDRPGAVLSGLRLAIPRQKGLPPSASKAMK